MKTDKSCAECLTQHFSNLNFILENGTTDEIVAMWDSVNVIADNISHRIGQRAPGITLEQAEKYSMAGNKNVKEPPEKNLFHFLKKVTNHINNDDLRRIEASIPKNDMDLYPLKLIIQGIIGLDSLKTYTFLNTKMPIVQKSKVIDFRQFKTQKEMSNGTR